MHRPEVQEGDIQEGIINDTSIFGGGKRRFDSNQFKGGSIIAIFGGSEIDLLDCKLAPGENVLEVFAMFGGTTLLIPAHWKIKMDLVPVFGGFSDKRRRDAGVVSDDKDFLVIKGTVLFGGGEIKN